MVLPTKAEIEANLDDPRSLFKFYAVNSNSLSCLLRNEVWLANPATLNDPFDLFIDELDPAELRQVADAAEAADGPLDVYEDSWHELASEIQKNQQLVRERLSTSGVFSMTASPFDLLLWSHYGDGHRGFCVEYERRSDNMLGRAKRVDYTDLRLLFVDPGTPVEVERQRAFRTKATCWSYEREWRLIRDVELERNRWLKLDAPIKAVLFGMRTPMNDKETVIRAFEERGEHVEFYAMHMLRGRYELMAELLA